MAGFDRLLNCTLARILGLAGEFHDQDRVLRGKANENDETDLGQDDIVHASQVDPEQGTQHGQRNDEDDSRRKIYCKTPDCSDGKPSMGHSLMQRGKT